MVGKKKTPKKMGRKSKPDTPQNWKNRTLFNEDNLKVMRALNSETIDLIATDPPFNKGRDFHATPDSLASGASFQDRWRWKEDVHEEWIDQIQDDHPAAWSVISWSRMTYGDDMGAFLCFMAVRLFEMRRLLKPTGTIYLHCDPTASHYLKAIMDAVFGKENFRNEIIWHYGAGHPPKNDFARKHDIIFRYSKGRTVTFNTDDPALRIPFNDTALKMHFNNVDKDGRQYRKYASGKISYADDGKVVTDVWTDIDGQEARSPISKEYTGYPTQKPLALYQRIVIASSNEDDVVFDPFAGCATTLVAAEHAQRQWVGVDIWSGAGQVVNERLKDAAGLFGKVNFTKDLPERTDDAEPAAPLLKVVKTIPEPKGPRMSRQEMKEYLLEQHGAKCAGCNRKFDDARYLELDHNTPKSDGGMNQVHNRILLCGPCNRLKSNKFTLSGLRQQNKKLGYMVEK